MDTSFHSPPEHARPFGLNGRQIPAPERPIRLMPEDAKSRRHQVQRFAAAMLLVIVLAGGLFVIQFGWPGSDDGGHGITVPAPFASPAPTSVATPPAGPVEFLWQSGGDPADPLRQGARLTVAPDGSIWVPDGKQGRFHIFAPDGTFLEIWGSPGAGEGQFNFLSAGFYGDAFGAIAFSPDGAFYVADTGNKRVQKFGPDRAFLFAWGSEGSADGQFLDPVDLDIDAQGRVYVADLSRGFALNAPQVGAIQVFDANGAFLTAWGARGLDPGQMLQPMGLGIDRDGNVIVVERQNHRVQRFTPEGEYLDGWGKNGFTEGRFDDPKDAAADALGRIFILDGANNRIQIFDHAGRFLAVWGSYGSEEGQFTGLSGIALDDQGNIYVADAGRLQKFRVLTLPDPIATPRA